MTTILECGHVPNGIDGNGRPACVIDGVTSTANADLSGRQARCFCGKTEDSRHGLAFIEFRGELSRRAREQCRNCKNHYVTHLELNTTTGRLGHMFGVCDFEPHGSFEFDEYYCGCKGWD